MALHKQSNTHNELTVTVTWDCGEYDSELAHHDRCLHLATHNVYLTVNEV
jgi:hypothetical protein